MYRVVSVMAAPQIPNLLSLGSSPRRPAKYFAAVAHQVEQQTENLCVAGSSPARGTKFKDAFSKLYTLDF